MLEAPIFIYNSLYFGPATGEIGEHEFILIYLYREKAHKLV